MNSQLQKIFQESIPENKIDNELYTKYDVKKGLRNEDGTGVLIGLTRIADVVGYKLIDGKKVDDRGELILPGDSDHPAVPESRSRSDLRL